MTTARFKFTRIVTNVLEHRMLEKKDDHMVSELYIDLEIDGTTTPDVAFEISQPFGTDFDSMPIEVSKPKNYDGPWNHNAFAVIAEDAYRNSKGFSMGSNAIANKIIDCISHITDSPVFEIDIPDSGRGWAW